MAALGPRFPGYGDRIRERMRMLGYWKGDRPDVYRFAAAHGFRPPDVYRYLKGEVPRPGPRQALAAALGVTEAWLLLGDAGTAVQRLPRGKPSAG